MSPRSRRTGRRTEPARGGERLQKVLAAAGVASRRACEDLIRSGRVRVNGTIVSALGTRANPARDRITIDGKRIGRPQRPQYYLVYKPRGVVTTTRDPHAKRTVLDLVPRRSRLFPVGRLDAASEGLLLLTNDGSTAQLLLHPSFEVPRSYRVSVDGRVGAESVRRLRDGIPIGGRTLALRGAQVLERSSARSVLELTLVEGRRRQIREMMQALGHPVRRLVRMSFGPLRLGGLRPGKWRLLTPEELRALERMLAEARRRASRPRTAGHTPAQKRA